VVTVDGLMSKLMDRKVLGTEAIEGLVSNKFKKVNGETTLAKLSHILQGGQFAIVIETLGKGLKYLQFCPYSSILHNHYNRNIFGE
jgi:hypothetical protein